jgi:hypothetical protein
MRTADRAVIKFMTLRSMNYPVADNVPAAVEQGDQLPHVEAAYAPDGAGAGQPGANQGTARTRRKKAPKTHKAPQIPLGGLVQTVREHVWLVAGRN